jgi:DNA (cytosine-5)-methyltransferase 1
MGFEEHGFCVVRGPDLLWGGDVRLFHPPADVFDGVIGGPPCQPFSSLAHINRHRGQTIQPDLIPEFVRVVAETQPRWFVMENVIGAPLPEVAGYRVDPSLLNDRWIGEEQSRLHRFSFGTRNGAKLNYRIVALENGRKSARVLANGSVALRIDNAGKPRFRKLTSRSWTHLRESCRLQGLPEEMFDHSPFTCEAAHKAIGNAVALPMARELARAVVEALNGKEGTDGDL